MAPINFEYTDYLESIHPSVSVFVTYSVMADVTTGFDSDGEEVCSVVFTSIRSKVCTLRGELEWETLDIPTFGSNKERNKMLALFTELAIKKHDEEIERRNQTPERQESEKKEDGSDDSLFFKRVFKIVEKHEKNQRLEDEQANKTA